MDKFTKSTGESASFHGGDDYKRAISLDLNLVDAYINLGRLYREKGFIQEAVRLFNGSAARAPERAELYYGLGVAYLELGKREEAVALLAKACQLNPNLFEVQHALSRAYTQEDMADKARKEGEISQEHSQ